jgi:hypothetical protein
MKDTSHLQNFEKWAASNLRSEKFPVAHSVEWVELFNKYNKQALSIKFPPVGGGKRFLIQKENEPFAGADTIEEAKSMATMYKSPGNRKHPGNACEKFNWTVKDTVNNAIVFTANASR